LVIALFTQETYVGTEAGSGVYVNLKGVFAVFPKKEKFL
jgi:hypothetical protein